MLLLKLMVPNIEEQCVPSKHPGARGDLAVLLPLTGDAVAALGRAFWQHQGRALFCPHGRHPNAWGYMNAQTELASQPQEREPVWKQPCLTWKCKVFRRERRRPPKSLGLPRVFLALLWYFGGVA